MSCRYKNVNETKILKLHLLSPCMRLAYCAASSIFPSPIFGILIEGNARSNSDALSPMPEAVLMLCQAALPFRHSQNREDRSQSRIAPRPVRGSKWNENTGD